MKTLSRIVMSLALAAPITITSAVHADDKTPATDTQNDKTNDKTSARDANKSEVTMDQLPKPVQATVKREGNGKTPESMTKSTDSKGMVAYEVKYLADSKETTLRLAADGKVIQRHVRATGAD